MLIRKRVLQPIDSDGLRIFDYTAHLAAQSGAQGAADGELGASVALIDVPSGAGHPQAWSKRSAKYFLVVQGSLDFELHGEKATLAVGDFCYVKKGGRVSLRNADRRSAKLVLVHTPSLDLSAEVIDGEPPRS